VVIPSCGECIGGCIPTTIKRTNIVRIQNNYTGKNYSLMYYNRYSRSRYYKASNLYKNAEIKSKGHTYMNPYIILIDNQTKKAIDSIGMKVNYSVDIRIDTVINKKIVAYYKKHKQNTFKEFKQQEIIPIINDPSPPEKPNALLFIIISSLSLISFVWLTRHRKITI